MIQIEGRRLGRMIRMRVVEPEQLETRFGGALLRAAVFIRPDEEPPPLRIRKRVVEREGLRDVAGA